ncbi:MAG: hypothetical protein ACPG8W_00235 [Candidatus Promineifilaceae bacterium]
MSEFNDPLASIPDPQPLKKTKLEEPRKPKAKQSEFDDPLSKIRKTETARATKKATSMRGQYWQRTLRLPPEYQDLTLQIHHEGRARSIADTERWIYAMGLQAYFAEGKRPTYVKSVARDIKLPNLGENLE